MYTEYACRSYFSLGALLSLQEKATRTRPGTKLQHTRCLPAADNPLDRPARGVCKATAAAQLLHAQPGDVHVRLDRQVGVGILERGVVQDVMQAHRLVRFLVRFLVVLSIVFFAVSQMSHDCLQRLSQLQVARLEQEPPFTHTQGLVGALEAHQCFSLDAHAPQQ